LGLEKTGVGRGNGILWHKELSEFIKLKTLVFAAENSSWSIAKMGQFSTCDFIGTRTRFQRFSDSKLFHGWIQYINLSSMVVRSATDSFMQKGERFIFHVSSSHSNARFIADFSGVDGLEMMRTSSLVLQDSTTASLIEVPEANFAFKVVSQLEYQPPTEEVRYMVDGWVVQVHNAAGAETKAFLSDVSETGAGILSPTSYQRGERVVLHVEARDRELELEAEIRYSVRSKIAPDMFKAGLKFNDFGRLEGAVWRNFLKAA
jgi:hypothetical protein